MISAGRSRQGAANSPCRPCSVGRGRGRRRGRRAVRTRPAPEPIQQRHQERPRVIRGPRGSRVRGRTATGVRRRWPETLLFIPGRIVGEKALETIFARLRGASKPSRLSSDFSSAGVEMPNSIRTNRQSRCVSSGTAAGKGRLGFRPPTAAPSTVPAPGIIDPMATPISGGVSCAHHIKDRCTSKTHAELHRGALAVALDLHLLPGSIRPRMMAHLGRCRSPREQEQ